MAEPLSVCIYSWHGNPNLVKPYEHNEVITVQDEDELWSIARAFYKKGLDVMLRKGRTPENISLLAVSNTGWGQR